MIIRLLLLFFTTSCFLFGIENAEARQPSWYPGRVVVKFRHGVVYKAGNNAARVPVIQQASRQFGQPIVQQKFPSAVAYARQPGAQERLPRGGRWVDLTSIYNLDFGSAANVPAICQWLSMSADVEYAEPQYVAFPLATKPNDFYINSQRPLPVIKAFDAWDISRGDTSIVIAITDNAIQYDHPDLLPNLQRNYADPVDGIDNDGNGFVDDFFGLDLVGADAFNPLPDKDPRPGNTNLRHGSWVTGYAAALANNSIGVAGMGWKCRFIPVKLAAENLAGGIYVGYEGIVYAADRGAHIINCSWGGTTYSRLGQDAVNYAVLTRGAVVVAASGGDPYYYPASFDNVLSVGTVDVTDKKSATVYSGANIRMDLVTPSGGSTTDWKTTYLGGGYYTSFSAPLASGAAGLVKQVFPMYGPQQIAERLRITTDNIDALNPTFAQRLGKGRLNVFKALTVTTPAIRTLGIQLSNGRDGVPMPGDTITLDVTWRNWLDAATSATASLRSFSPYLVVLPADSQVTLGNLATMATVNPAQKLRFRIRPDAPADALLYLQFGYTATGYTDYEWYELEVRRTYANIDRNKLRTTLTANGRLGWQDYGTNARGLGVQFGGKASALFESGLLMGRDTLHVSDNIRNMTGWQDLDWAPTSGIRYLPPSGSRVQIAETWINDSGSDTLPLGVGARLRAIADTAGVWKNAVRLEYTFYNLQPASANGLYTGLFFDWDIGSNAYLDSAFYDSGRKLAYATSDTAKAHKKFFGVLALSLPAKVKAYAGTPVLDLYKDSGKFRYMATPPDSQKFKSDIVQMLSYGPLNIADSLTLEYALIGAESRAELLARADSVRKAYQCEQLAFAVFAGNDTTICEPAVLRARTTSPAASYLWNTGATSDTLAVTVAGTYWVRAITTGGCVAVDTVKVEYQPKPVVTLDSDTVSCGPLVLRAHYTTPGALLWNSGATTDSITVTSSGTYWVRQLNASGCQTTDTIRVEVYPVPTLAVNSTGLATTLEQGFRAVDRTPGIVSRLWSASNGATGTDSVFVFTPADTGRYTVQLLASTAHCSATQTWEVQVVHSVAALAGPAVFPNPVRGAIWFQSSFMPEGNYQVTVVDANGRTVQRYSRHLQPYRQHELPGIATAGIYFLLLEGNGQQFKQKIVVE